MKHLLSCLVLLCAEMSFATGNDCWQFRDKEDPKSPLRTLTVDIKPSGGDGAQVAHLIITRRLEKPIHGQARCEKKSPTQFECHIENDGGSFELSIFDKKAELRATYLSVGDKNESFELDPLPKEDPWVFEGETCKAKSSRKR